jgi:lipid-binding SYLF domain-containing protein
MVSLSLLFLTGSFTKAQYKKDKEIIEDSKEAKAEFIEGDPDMAKLFNGSYGYSIFPNVDKGAIGIGGAAGNGTAYEKGKLIGMTKLSQVSIGFQFGGQEYREVVFFESKKEMDRFKQNKTEFSAQVSAVAVKSGVSADAKYTDGVIVFTMQKGGLMYEAAVGGQKFKFKELE